MSDWDASEVRPLAVEVLGERYRRYRLSDPAAEEAVARSLQRYGQMAPVVVCVHDGTAEVVDGFKRLAAARLLLPRWPTLSVRLLSVDERAAKAAIYALNRVSSTTHELEEAWIVHALVREDGLSQVEAAALLGRHKSWVCRRLALLERLAPPAQEDLRLGLMSVSVARQVVRLPAGNQTEVLQVTRRDGLNAAEVRGVVDLLLASASHEQEEYVLAKPREALQQAHGATPRAWDPRLSVAGNGRAVPVTRDAPTPGSVWPCCKNASTNWDRWHAVSSTACAPSSVKANTRRSTSWHCWPATTSPTGWPPWNGPTASVPIPWLRSSASWPLPPSPEASWPSWPSRNASTSNRTCATIPWQRDPRLTINTY